MSPYSPYWGPYSLGKVKGRIFPMDWLRYCAICKLRQGLGSVHWAPDFLNGLGTDTWPGKEKFLEKK